MPRRNDSRFDAFRLADSGAVLEGRLDPGELPRLADIVVEKGQSAIGWRIEGTHDPQGHPALAVELKGSVPLECQRCLGRVDVAVDQRTEVLLARTEEELARLDADSDLEVALADAPLDPRTLIEDELLLTLPYAPRHDGACP